MTQSSAAITARGIRKSFGEHTVLDDVHWRLTRGRASHCSAPTTPGPSGSPGTTWRSFATIRRGSGSSGSGNG